MVFRRRTRARAARRQPVTQRTYWFRRAVASLALVTVVVFGYYGVTLAQALTNQGYGPSLSARAAEWGRDHGFGLVVTWLEAEQYRLHPAKVGGSVGQGAFGSGQTSVKIPSSGHLAVPPRIISPVATPAPGEGVWHPVGRFTANGIPAVYEAFVRPDAVHTSYVVGVAWMDPTLLKAQLYSGSYIPGNYGPYKYTAPISAVASESVVAAFNAGFRMQDANGGYYTDGRTLVPLRKGAASAVIFKDGTMTVGMWGRDVKSLAGVASVRQNLDLIVDHGRAVPGLASQNSTKWGITLGGTFNVWRSGMGVTKDGALVYVGGPALSISDLADTLVRAGAVRAMQLDINSDWVQYSTYKAKPGVMLNGGNGTSLLHSMFSTPSRYFANWFARDFFVMSLRPKEMKAGSATKK